MKAHRWLVLLLGILLVVCGGCGGNKEGADAKSPSADTGMNDAFALLPGNAILLGTVDGRAFFASQTFGSQLAQLVEKYMPIGQEAGFQASRDVDRVTFASYSYQGLDVAAVVIGKFDAAKIKQVAASHTPTKGGGVLVASTYAGRDLYTVNNVGFTVLSERMALAGSEQGMRRVLERIKDGRVKRDIAPWMIEALEAPGTAGAAAVDFAANPVPPDVLRQIPGPAKTFQSMRALRILAAFKDPGVQLAATGTLADDASAQEAGNQARQAASLSKWLAVFGVRVQNIQVNVDKSNVQVQLGVDDQSLRQLLAVIPQWVGG